MPVKNQTTDAVARTVPVVAAANIPKTAVGRAEMLIEVDRMLDACKALRTKLSDALIEQLEGKAGEHKLGAPVVAVVEITSRSERAEWQHEDIAKAVLDVEMPKRPIANLKAAKAIVETAGISYWRIKELRARGIEPEGFASKVSRALSVSAHRPDETGEPF